MGYIFRPMEKTLKDIVDEKQASDSVKELIIGQPRMKMVRDKEIRLPINRPRMTHPEKVIAILRAVYSDLTDGQEYAHVITLDNKMQFINIWAVGQGGHDHVTLSRAEVFRRVLADDNAAAFIIAHNHTSGNEEPSDEDFEMLNDFKRGGLYMERPLRDFIVLADGNDKYYSHRDLNYEL